mgnify:FL=1
MLIGHVPCSTKVNIVVSTPTLQRLDYISKSKTRINIYTDYGYVMEQFEIVETFNRNNPRISAKFVVLMVIMFMVAFAVTVLPVAPTLIILVAPALLMNLGWILFAVFI